ncbi:odorant receptor 49b-like [Anopheles ziemanni]|uniref:odorant receptor 49b-like n=1 Tax=Anopheles coustani TaxID=139045 RepID=UPI00265A7BC8|nr:odorant receptor 49b-like [Anopheles coustani]XP_058170517.1 odorant receptor 49b-like [Anopheles ziemanni]
MLPRTKADSFRVMPYNLRVLATLGVCGDQRKLYRLLVLLVLTFVAIIIPKPVQISDRHPFESIVRSVAEFNFAMLCYLTIIIVASKSEPFRQVVHKMEQTLAPFRDSDDRCSRLIIEVNDKIHRFSVAYARLHVCYMLLFNLVPPACNYPYYLLQRGSNRTVEFMLPLAQDFYGLDIHGNVAHYSVFCASIIPACCFTTLILWTKGILLILIRYNTLLYQLVNRRLEEYQSSTQIAPMSDEQKKRKLAEIVELHYAAIECNGLLDSIMSLILLIQFVGCLLMLCLMMYYISRNPNMNVVNVVVLFLSIMIEMMCFSYLGNQLTEENTNIGQTAYNCHWYDEPVTVQSYFLRIILQSQRQATITAGKFYNVNIVTFAQLIKTSFTYYMIMKEMF